MRACVRIHAGRPAHVCAPVGRRRGAPAGLGRKARMHARTLRLVLAIKMDLVDLSTLDIMYVHMYR